MQFIPEVQRDFACYIFDVDDYVTHTTGAALGQLRLHKG